MSIARIIKEEYGGGRDLSGIGGVETGRDAAEFILLGANSVQVCCLTPRRIVFFACIEFPHPEHAFAICLGCQFALPPSGLDNAFTSWLQAHEVPALTLALLIGSAALLRGSWIGI